MGSIHPAVELQIDVKKERFLKKEGGKKTKFMSKEGIISRKVTFLGVIRVARWISSLALTGNIKSMG